MPANRPAAYALKLMNQFEEAVRQHVTDNQYGQCSQAQQIRYEKAKEKLARKIGQLATDAARNDRSLDNPANHTCAWR